MTQNSKETRERPGWRGPGGAKKKAAPQKTRANSKNISKRGGNSTYNPTTGTAAEDSGPQVPIELQQLLLNIFKDSFPSVLVREDLKPLLQEIKSALFERDFDRAFGRPEFLEAYAVRWSPGRALGYADTLVDLKLKGFFPGFLLRDEVVRVVCFGGGAAEGIALGGLVRFFLGPSNALAIAGEDEGVREGLVEGLDALAVSAPRKMDLLLVDRADWAEVVSKLDSGLTSLPPLSIYASASARFSNAPLIPEGTLNTTFQQSDVLEMDKAEFERIVGPGTTLVTLLFTLNELYTSSIAKTTAFLLNLTSITVVGTLLLVVDSPGSYSEASVGRESVKKKYPMQWLMDHTLLNDDEGKPMWKKEMMDESRWFRLDERLRYPISLENMRSQVHLFRRI